jgi:dUTP pyrophosphatase
MCRFFGLKTIDYNVGNQSATIYRGKKYEIGERVAQIVFLELPKITLVEVDELSETQRGSGGFGHTGK